MSNKFFVENFQKVPYKIENSNFFVGQKLTLLNFTINKAINYKFISFIFFLAKSALKNRLNDRNDVGNMGKLIETANAAPTPAP